MEAPDGSVWVVDMYRRVIEHPEWIPDAWQEQLDLRSGSDAGRIYRVQRKRGADADKTRAIWPSTDLHKADPKTWLRSMRNPNGGWRDLASQQIMWSSDDSIERGIAAIVRDESLASDIRLQAFGLLIQMGWDESEDWQSILSDPDDRAVAWAIRAAAHALDSGSCHQLANVVKTQRGPAVEFALLLTLGGSSFDLGDQTWMDDALVSLIRRNWQTSWGIQAVSMFAESQAAMAFPILAQLLDEQDVEEIEPLRWNELETCFESLWRTCSADSRQQVLTHALEKRGDDESDSKEWSASELLVVLAASTTIDKDSGSEPDPSTAQLRGVIQKARQVLRTSEQPLSLRLRASRLLGNQLIDVKDQVEDLKGMLEIDQPGPIRAAALAGSYRAESDETAEVLINAWSHLLPEERNTACATLLQRKAWTRSLVESLVGNRIEIADLDASTIASLQNCQDYWVMKQVGGLLTKPTTSERKALIDRYVSTLKQASGSDFQAGEKLYRENCAACHEVSKTSAEANQQASALGPPLANLKQWTEGQWVTAILDPNATLEPKYKQYRVLTQSGRVFSGVVLEQNDTTIRLGQSDGRQVSVQRSELEELKDAGVSLMPEGFEAKLSPEQLSAIIGYLRAR